MVSKQTTTKETTKARLPSKTKAYVVTGVPTVIDGDTLAVPVKWFPKPFKQEVHVRVYGINTPESELDHAPGGQAEVDMGLKAKEYAKTWLKEQLATPKRGKVVVKIHTPGLHDKYGGRILGDVSVNGKLFGDVMLESGLAKPYMGGKKEAWV